MIKLALNQPYPLPIKHQECAAAQFLLKTGNILQIILTDMDKSEQEALRFGAIKAGFLYQEGALLLLFQFYTDFHRQRKIALTFDAPFDVRLIPADLIQWHDITNPEQRLAIEIHAMNEQHIIKALRLVTMPNDMTLKFLSAVQEQYQHPQKGERVMQQWMQRDPPGLIYTTQTWTLGT